MNKLKKYLSKLRRENPIQIEIKDSKEETEISGFNDGMKIVIRKTM